jgi:hypothetical protein
MRITEILLEKPVESSWIVNISHNRPNKVITLRLNNGTAYSIPGITRTTFEQWTKAPSKGRFFHSRIRGKHPINKIR